MGPILQKPSRTGEKEKKSKVPRKLEGKRVTRLRRNGKKKRRDRQRLKELLINTVLPQAGTAQNECVAKDGGCTE